MRKPLSIASFVAGIQNGSINIEEHAHQAWEDATKAREKQRHFNALNPLFLEQAHALHQSQKKNHAIGRLTGLPISVKECICVEGLETTSSSRILSGYKPPYHATAIQKCVEQNALVLGKTTQDEFGFGTFSTNEGFGRIPLNPHDESRSCGGSSGGSGGFTALAKTTHVSIGESTGGSIACPASFCGVVGLTPTYGRVSRYGLLDYASSLDKIGPMTRRVEDAALLLEIMAGHDSLESTSLSNPVPAYSKTLSQNPSPLRIGVVKEFFGEGIDPDVAKVVWNAIHAWEKNGAKIKEVSLPKNAKLALSAYYVIASSEASTNLAKYCGLRYGKGMELEGKGYDAYFAAVRSQFFGNETKRRILLGTFARMSGYRDAFYLRSQKVRTLLIQEYQSVFKEVDVLVHPTMPMIAPRFDDIRKLSPIQEYAADLCTVPANLAGVPHISLPAGKHQSMPVGIMLTANHLEEEKLLQLAYHLEQTIQPKESFS